MEMRDVLGYFAYKYNGDSRKILEALDKRETVTPSQINQFHEKIEYDFFTAIDDNYPEILKSVENPPIVMFYKGDIELIHPDNEIIAKQSSDGIHMIHAYQTEFTNKGITLHCVMACECHDDMDMLMNQMERTHHNLEKLLSIVHSRQPKSKDIER